MIENQNFDDVESEEHLQFLEDYGSLSLFPIRLRELAQYLENAAIAANDLNFPTIPDCEEDCSDSEEEVKDEDEDEEDKDEDEEDEDEEDEDSENEDEDEDE